MAHSESEVGRELVALADLVGMRVDSIEALDQGDGRQPVIVLRKGAKIIYLWAGAEPVFGGNAGHLMWEGEPR